MKIWRVENSYKEGPYHSLNSPWRFAGASPKWPVPSLDGITKEIAPTDHFGFANWQQLLSWFNKSERRVLDKSGFKASLYLVNREHVMLGGKQAVFDIDLAVMLTKRRLV